MNTSQIYTKLTTPVDETQQVVSEARKLREHDEAIAARNAWLSTPVSRELVSELNTRKNDLVKQAQVLALSGDTESMLLSRSKLIESLTLERIVKYVTTGNYPTA